MQQALLDSARILFRVSKNNENDELLRASGVLGDIVDMLDVHILSGASSQERQEGKDDEQDDSFALAPTHVGLLDELILTSAVLKNASFNESNQRFLGDRKLLATLARYVRVGGC